MGKLQYNNWISNWLTSRRQKVVVDGDSSEEVIVESGIPQGTLYVNDIGKDITSSIRFLPMIVFYTTV